MFTHAYGRTLHTLDVVKNDKFASAVEAEAVSLLETWNRTRRDKIRQWIQVELVRQLKTVKTLFVLKSNVGQPNNRAITEKGLFAHRASLKLRQPREEDREPVILNLSSKAIAIGMIVALWTLMLKRTLVGDDWKWCRWITFMSIEQRCHRLKQEAYCVARSINQAKANWNHRKLEQVVKLLEKQISMKISRSIGSFFNPKLPEVLTTVIITLAYRKSL